MSKTTTTSLLLLLALPAAALADPAGERAAVERLLLAYESAPDRAALDVATPDPEGTLLALLSDKTRTRVVRLRAIDALAHVPTLRVRGVLHRLAGASSQPREERASAVTALLYAWKAGALTSATPLLRSGDQVLRLAVADALVRYAGSAGRDAVRRELAREKDPLLRKQLGALLDPRPQGPAALR